MVTRNELLEHRVNVLTDDSILYARIQEVCRLRGYKTFQEPLLNPREDINTVSIVDCRDTGGIACLEQIGRRPSIAITRDDIPADIAMTLLKSGANTFIREASINDTTHLTDLILRVSPGVQLAYPDLQNQRGVLVVDDDLMVLKTLPGFLQDDYPYVHCVTSVEAAMLRLMEHRYAVIILDKDLHSKTTGVDLAGMLSGSLPFTKLIIGTGYPDVGDIQKLGDLIADYMIKPFEMDEVLAKVRSADRDGMSELQRSLESEKCRIYAIFGAHGSGKSTLRKGMIAALHNTVLVPTVTEGGRPQEWQIDPEHVYGHLRRPESNLVLTRYKCGTALGISFDFVRSALDKGLSPVLTLPPYNPQEVLDILSNRFGENLMTILVTAPLEDLHMNLLARSLKATSRFAGKMARDTESVEKSYKLFNDLACNYRVVNRHTDDVLLMYESLVKPIVLSVRGLRNS